MWGYGVLGVATWLIACVFGDSPLERVTRATYVANGIVSIAAAIATMVQPGWVMSPTGIASFASWNLLMLAIGVLTIVVMRARRLT